MIVDVELTHQLLGRLVAAQRPTISLALSELAAAGPLTRSGTGGWRVAADAISP